MGKQKDVKYILYKNLPHPPLTSNLFFSLKETKGLRILIEDYYLIMERHVLSYIPQFFQAKYSC